VVEYRARLLMVKSFTYILCHRMVRTVSLSFHWNICAWRIWLVDACVMIEVRHQLSIHHG